MGHDCYMIAVFYRKFRTTVPSGSRTLALVYSSNILHYLTAVVCVEINVIGYGQCSEIIYVACF